MAEIRIASSVATARMFISQSSQTDVPAQPEQ
jgi:hypothetical protein